MPRRLESGAGEIHDEFEAATEIFFLRPSARATRHAAVRAVESVRGAPGEKDSVAEGSPKAPPDSVWAAPLKIQHSSISTCTHPDTLDVSSSYINVE